LLTGDKHLITGADGAAFAIVLARHTADRATMAIVDMADPRVTIGDHAHTIDAVSIGGHCPVHFDGVFVPSGRILGEPGNGFRYAQVRLTQGRLSHCMRWLGAARRAHEIAVQRSVHRELFGQRLSDLGMAQRMIAENEIDMAAARALLWQTSWAVAEGDTSTEASSRAKVFVSEATARVVDRSVQLCGGLGTTDDLVVGRIYADIRAFRIYDGASEVHKMSIARRASRRALAAENTPL
jgi:alkylation response protein AidB-like acyl-CoA dehydrogenase